MFESLSERFEGIFSRLRSKGTLRESDVDEVLREIRLALLEADVNFVVVKTMLDRIRERASAPASTRRSTPPSRSSSWSTRPWSRRSAARRSASSTPPGRPPWC